MQSKQDLKSVMSNQGPLSQVGGKSVETDRFRTQRHSDQMKRKIRNLAEQCNRINQQTKDTVQNFNIDIEDERSKQDTFNLVCGLLKELDNTHSSVIESLYQYKMDDRKEFGEEAKVEIKEYKMGALDPSKDTSKYEQKMMYKRRKEILKNSMKRID